MFYLAGTMQGYRCQPQPRMLAGKFVCSLGDGVNFVVEEKKCCQVI
jgi:hypothetical protein